MGAINNAFNKAGWSILQLASATAKYRALRNEEGKNRAKQSYNTAATIKKQNDELTKNQSEYPNSFFDYWNITPEIDEQKIAEQKALEEIEKKAKVARFGEILTVNPEMNEQKIAEQKVLEQTEQERAKVTTFDELPTVSAERSETNIDANDPEVQGLIEVKQKNLNRSISASRAQKAYQASKGYENDFPIRDYMPNVSDEELRKAGITKTELNKLSSILAGNGTDEDVRNWFEKHGGGDGAYTIKLDDLNVTAQAADAIKNFILDKDKLNDSDELYESTGEDLEEPELNQSANKQPSVDDWYLNFDRNNNIMSNSDNYKVWQDDSTELQDDSTEEKKDEVKTNRDFSGFKF